MSTTQIPLLSRVKKTAGKMLAIAMFVGAIAAFGLLAWNGKSSFALIGGILGVLFGITLFVQIFSPTANRR